MRNHVTIHPDLRDVWFVSRVVMGVLGVNLGLFLYTYSAFLYQRFSGFGSAHALKLVVWIMVLCRIFMLITDVPTGAIGDYLGRKKVVILSFVFTALAFFIRSWLPFISSTNLVFALACCEAVFYALSYTFFTGSFVAWIVDTVGERNVPEGHGPLLAKSWSYMFLAQVVGAAVGIALYLANFIFYAFALSCMVSAVCALFCGVFMEETRALNFHKGKLTLRSTVSKTKEIISTGLRIGAGTPAVLYLIIIYACFMFLNNLINYLWPVAMEANFGAGKMSPYWFIIVFLALAMAFVGSRVLEKLNLARKGHKLTNVTLWICCALTSFVLGALVVALGVDSMRRPMPLVPFIVVIVFCRFSYGFLSPAFNTLMNDYIPKENSQQRATILSVTSMLVNCLTIFLMIPSSGPSGESTAMGWVIPGGILLFVTLIVHVLMRRYQRKIGEIPVAGTLPATSL